VYEPSQNPPMTRLDAQTRAPTSAVTPALVTGSASLLLRARQLASAAPRRLLPLGHDHAGPLGLGATKDRSGLGNRALFLAVVVLPTLLTAIYMLAIASNQYISEAHFIVRSAQKQNAGGLTAMLQGSGLSGIRDEASSVIDYIKSRDALKEILPDTQFRDVVNRPGADFLARFPTFHRGDSFEELFEHYSNIVTVVHDATTGINTLKVRAFTAEDAQRVAEALLRMSEHLVNRMNERSLRDAVTLAAREVKTAEDRSATAQRALTQYRVSVGLVDPSSTAKTFLELIGGLERELSVARTQYAQTKAGSPNNPNLPNLRDRVVALEQQVEAERNRLFGSETAKVNTFADFERLTIEAEFAAKALVVANTMLETARLEALRKQLYLDRVVEPNAADLSRYPRRFLSIITVFGTAFLAYAILWLVMANAREHAH
jgi:capsular polysaccharide transport system permease protein